MGQPYSQHPTRQERYAARGACAIVSKPHKPSRELGLRIGSFHIADNGLPTFLLFVEFDDEVFRLCPAAKCVSGMAFVCFAGGSSLKAV
jgi:hypothetical protein